MHFLCGCALFSGKDLKHESNIIKIFVIIELWLIIEVFDYYTRQIKSNPTWDFVNVYSDEGISATSTKKREGFNRMITDALKGKIDLIITKSVSRFARNSASRKR